MAAYFMVQRDKKANGMIDEATIKQKTDDRYHDQIEACRQFGPLKTAIVHPVNPSAIEALIEAVEEKLINPVLIGPKARILASAQEMGSDFSEWEIIDTEHSHASAAKASELAATGQVEAIMKGSLHTDELLAAVLSADSGLRTERRASHAFVIEVPTYPKPLIITDAAINIEPDLLQKADICQNAINLWKVMYGFENTPKVAILAAVETVTPKMRATLDAAALCKMSERGQITGAILDGPLAFDNAIDKGAAAEKGLTSPVAGDADILIMPDIESGNMLSKQLIFLGRAPTAGIVLGARVPVILTSRADSVQNRILSVIVAIRLAAARREGKLK